MFTIWGECVSQIISLQNQRIKDIARLTKRSVRDERRLAVVEGLRETERALANGVIPVEAYLCPQVVAEEDRQRFIRIQQQLAGQQSVQLFEVTPEVFARIAYREGGDGVLLVIPYLEHRVDDLPLRTAPFLCVIEGVEKPGNLGAILRTADAAGVDGVIVCAGATDLHNPNVIRASLGALFTVPVVEVSTPEAIAWLRRRNIQIVATTPAATQLYTDADFTGPVAVVMGSEATGLGEEWLAAATLQVAIPMLGSADSLNLATATALILYEVVRQRGINPAKANC
jgi:TrmH family RNA methyltransferase